MDLYTLRNASGMGARITNLGGIVTSLKAPDRHGQHGEVVFCFDDWDQYLSHGYLTTNPYFGCLVGR